MAYFNYHATAKRLLGEGKLIKWQIVAQYRGISPAMVLIFDDFRHPIMPIRKERWGEYLPLLDQEKKAP